HRPASAPRRPARWPPRRQVRPVKTMACPLLRPIPAFILRAHGLERQQPKQQQKVARGAHKCRINLYANSENSPYTSALRRLILSPGARPAPTAKRNPRRSGIVRKNRRKTRHEEAAHCHGHFGICDLHNSGAHGPGSSGACQEPDVRAGRITEESYGLVRILWLFRLASDSGAGRGPLEARCTSQRLLQDGCRREGHGRLVPILWVLAPLDG